ncbi:MarR family winged helix-turn-helix transcriptional regulator [Roseibium aggregatum]|uniref:MarR family winged helix-turn-helix transcriptional regulator n=1 Tax=Roseibium aggregatum TaxID=187304 RepID=UPI000A9B5FAB|nr:MarR family winged helix-turn-helix transcriptional regulator [Roseibium aggregatum]UFI02135.1 MarR family winged helix-turn-helix transcriptional regulator [Roseibium aggregatum]
MPQRGCDVTVPLRFAENPASRDPSLWTTFINAPVPLTRPFVPMPAPAALLKKTVGHGCTLEQILLLLYLQQMSSSLKDIDFQHMGRTCLGHAARRTANLLTRHYNRHMAVLGLELTQAQLLAAIADGSASSAAEIARFLGIDRSTLARNLKPLEVAGLVTRQDGKGRKVLPVLTQLGEAKVIEIHRTWLKAQEEVSALLGPDGADAVRTQMSTLRKAVHILESQE